jgi:hypothetical protein
MAGSNARVLPSAGSTSAAYWITRDIVYAVDYTRGIDILRYAGPGAGAKLTCASNRGTGRGWIAGQPARGLANTSCEPPLIRASVERTSDRDVSLQALRC